MSTEMQLISKILDFYNDDNREFSIFQCEEWVKDYARRANAPVDMLPNWIFKVGVDHKGEINYEVNGAFMYLSKEEMTKYREMILEAIMEAEKFYRSKNK